MSDNKVSVEISMETKAANKSLDDLTKSINKIEAAAEGMGKGTDSSFSQFTGTTKKSAQELKNSEKLFKEAEKAFADGLNKNKKTVEASAQQIKVYEDRAKAAENASKSMFLKMKEGAGDGFGSLVAGVTVANLASQAITGTAGAITRFATDCFNASLEAEKSQNKLAQSLRANGGFSEANVISFRNYAEALEDISEHSGPVIMDQISVAKAMGATNEEAKKLVTAAANLSATFGGPLESNVKALGQTLNGEVGKLSKLVPELKNLTAEQLRSGAALDIVNNKLNGATKSSLQGSQGDIKRLMVEFGRMQEAFGDFGTKSGATGYLLGGLASGIKAITNAINEQRIAMGMGLTADEDKKKKITELGREYNTLVDRINSTRAALEMEAKYGGDDEDSKKRQIAMQSQILAGEERQNIILKERVALRTAANADKNATDNTGNREVDDETLKNRQVLYSQLQQIQIEHAAWEAEQSLLSREITAENFAMELEQYKAIEQEKINAKYLAEEQKNLALEDSKAREIATELTASKKKMEIAKSEIETEKKLKNQQIALEQQKQAAIAGLIGSGFALASALAKDGSKEQFLIQKAAAIAELAIARGKAIAMIPAQTAHIPFPGNIPAAATLLAYTNAQSALGLATIVASTLKGFNAGGVVDSNYTTGDRNMIRVNGGETVMNSRQQANTLMAIANGGSGNNSGLIEEIRALRRELAQLQIVIKIDEREIARSVRNQKEMGFAI